MVIWLIVIAAAVVLDQASKLLVANFLDREEPFVIIDDIFRFSYVENKGAAFGSFAENRWVFMIISTVGIIALLVYLWKFRPDSKLACTGLSMIIGGGIGNMIDRVAYGYVIDFLDFCAFPEIWPWVFNVADSFVCVGAGILILWCIVSLFAELKLERAKKAAIAAGEAAEGDDIAVEESTEQQTDAKPEEKSTENIEE